MKLDNETLKKSLLNGSYIDQDIIEEAESNIATTKQSLKDYLLHKDILTEDLMGQAIAEDLGMRYADLNVNTPSKEDVEKIPEDVARKYCVVLYKEQKNKIQLATSNPENNKIIDKLSKYFPDKKIELLYSLDTSIKKLFIFYRKSLQSRINKTIDEKDNSTSDLLDLIFIDSAVYNASDIHFIPLNESVVLKYRIDGLLQEKAVLKYETYNKILNRIKVLANLRIDEHFATQDGSIRYSKDDIELDLRISIVPVVNGEKVVIRVLAQYLKELNIENLGLSEENKDMLVEESKSPFGMILNTGPTGSGKTTTLYALIKLLSKPELNVTSIEDPVEYRLPGISQIQVNKKTNLTFSKGLRSIVRQDPDVILVGEIRDTETAEIAVNAALTGHLLFSTFHANDASTAIPRLLDMGIEPFLLASTLNLIIAQRLVRKLCNNCRYSVSVPRSDIGKFIPDAENYFSSDKVTLYYSKGCKTCANTGYIGRSAIFEFIRITENIKSVILKNPSGSEVKKIAKEEGFKSLFEDGIEKVKKGITTIEEVIRVASPDTIVAIKGSTKKKKKPDKNKKSVTSIK